MRPPRQAQVFQNASVRVYGTWSFDGRQRSKHPGAIEASVLVVRTFVQLRRVLYENQELNLRLRKIEEGLIAHDSQIASIVDVIRQLTNPSMQPRRRIGFAPANPKIDP